MRSAGHNKKVRRYLKWNRYLTVSLFQVEKEADVLRVAQNTNNQTMEDCNVGTGSVQLVQEDTVPLIQVRGCDLHFW